MESRVILNNDHLKEMLEYKIMHLALERTARSNMINPAIKKSFLYLSLEPEKCIQLPEIDGSVVNFLGLSQESLSSTTNISPNDLKIIKDIYTKELYKLIREIVDDAIQFDSEKANKPDVKEVVQDLLKLQNDLIGDVKKLEESQKKLIETKYETILGKHLENVELKEENVIKTQQLVRDLYEKTTKIVYPSKEYYDKIAQAVLSLENELSEINQKIETLQHAKILYLENHQEFMALLPEYKEVMKQVKIKEAAVKELAALHNRDSN